jgi:hypothetical protein
MATLNDTPSGSGNVLKGIEAMILFPLSDEDLRDARRCIARRVLAGALQKDDGIIVAEMLGVLP